MRLFAVIIGLVTAALVSGCGYSTEVGEVKQTDLTQVDEGVEQQRIEEVLGSPVAGEDLEVGQLKIYAYDTGRSGEKVGISQGLGGFNPGVYVVFGIMAASKSLGARSEQLGHLAILYNSKQEAKWVWKGGLVGPDQALADSQTELAKLLEREAVVCETPGGSLSMIAPRECLEGEGAPVTWGNYGIPIPTAQDDPEAMYEYASSRKSYVEAWKWYCLAAHQGYAKAQKSLADYYRWGRTPVSSDLVRAYIWYSLAGGTFAADLSKDRIASEMTPAQVAEAERLVAEWEPNPAECEALAAGE